MWAQLRMGRRHSVRHWDPFGSSSPWGSSNLIKMCWLSLNRRSISRMAVIRYHYRGRKYTLPCRITISLHSNAYEVCNIASNNKLHLLRDTMQSSRSSQARSQWSGYRSNTHRRSRHTLLATPCCIAAWQGNSKDRIVYNEFAKTTGPSLNYCFYTGSKFDQEIVDILLRFRTSRVTLTADIERTYIPAHLCWGMRPRRPAVSLVEWHHQTATWGSDSQVHVCYVRGINKSLPIESHNHTPPEEVFGNTPWAGKEHFGINFCWQRCDWWRNWRRSHYYVPRIQGHATHRRPQSSQVQHKCFWAGRVHQPSREHWTFWPIFHALFQWNILGYNAGRWPMYCSWRTEHVRREMVHEKDHFILKVSEVGHQMRNLLPTKWRTVSLVGRIYDPLHLSHIIEATLNSLFCIWQYIQVALILYRVTYVPQASDSTIYNLQKVTSQFFNSAFPNLDTLNCENSMHQNTLDASLQWRI